MTDRYPCVGRRFTTQLEANIAKTQEAMRLAEEHYTLARFETWHCTDGHYHYG